MHQPLKRALAASLLGAALIAGTVPALTGCATKPKAERHAKKKSKMPKNYSLYKPRQINEALLRRGEKENAGPALDEY